jgi:methylated-DNA-[protein]-cysteine S-methyltransferase
MNSSSNYAATLSTPVGLLGIVLDADRLIAVERVQKSLLVKESRSPLAVEAIQQLENYFNNARFRFDLPLLMVGSEFQQAVWRQLQQIEPGQVKTYGDIAKELNSGPRAVGGACRTNPLPIVIPCHRVVARNGIGGYGGATAGHKLQQKRWLLVHEGAKF